MTVVVLRLEAPSDADAQGFIAATREWCEDHAGWSVSEASVGSGPPCPKCEKPMTWEPQLLTHVCHHSEE